MSVKHSHVVCAAAVFLVLISFSLATTAAASSIGDHHFGRPLPVLLAGPDTVTPALAFGSDFVGGAVFLLPAATPDTMVAHALSSDSAASSIIFEGQKFPRFPVATTTGDVPVVRFTGLTAGLFIAIGFTRSSVEASCSLHPASCNASTRATSSLSLNRGRTKSADTNAKIIGTAADNAPAKTEMRLTTAMEIDVQNTTTNASTVGFVMARSLTVLQPTPTTRLLFTPIDAWALFIPGVLAGDLLVPKPPAATRSSSDECRHFCASLLRQNSSANKNDTENVANTTTALMEVQTSGSINVQVSTGPVGRVGRKTIDCVCFKRGRPAQNNALGNINAVGPPSKSTSNNENNAPGINLGDTQTDTINGTENPAPRSVDVAVNPFENEPLSPLDLGLPGPFITNDPPLASATVSVQIGEEVSVFFTSAQSKDRALGVTVSSTAPYAPYTSGPTPSCTVTKRTANALTCRVALNGAAVITGIWSLTVSDVVTKMTVGVVNHDGDSIDGRVFIIIKLPMVQVTTVSGPCAVKSSACAPRAGNLRVGFVRGEGSVGWPTTHSLRFTPVPGSSGSGTGGFPQPQAPAIECFEKMESGMGVSSGFFSCDLISASSPAAPSTSPWPLIAPVTDPNQNAGPELKIPKPQKATEPAESKRHDDGLSVENTSTGVSPKTTLDANPMNSVEKQRETSLPSSSSPSSSWRGIYFVDLVTHVSGSPVVEQVQRLNGTLALGFGDAIGFGPAGRPLTGAAAQGNAGPPGGSGDATKVVVAVIGGVVTLAALSVVAVVVARSRRGTPRDEANRVNVQYEEMRV